MSSWWFSTRMQSWRQAAGKLAVVLAASLLGLATSGAAFSDTQHPSMKVPIVYLGKIYPEPPKLSLLEPILTDEGIQGARLGRNDNNATGRFLGQEVELVEAIEPEDGDVIARAKAMFADGTRLVVADLEAADLLAVADLPEAKDAIILNVRSSDDSLRQERCRTNVFHIIPSWAMRADALAQYLLWKKWSRWFLIAGKSPADQEFVAAIKRAAERFRGNIVEERSYAFEAGARRVETGHQQVQTQMPLLTQRAPDHDVVFAVDNDEAFGEYLLFRTDQPRPVVGTHGLVAVAWHRSFEQWGGMSLQSGFERLAGRIMTERDYTAWLALRAFGEAVVRTENADARKLRAYILSDQFEVAGFKGQAMTFRHWDRQLRQPILLSGPRSLVSMSPQEEFLHEKFHTDSLGFDEPETKCPFPG